MVGYVTMAAFVFALTFALFLAWPFIWKAATTLTFSETLGTGAGSGAGTGAANAGTGSRVAKGTEAPGGWSWLEIGGLVAGIAVFIVFVAAVAVYLRRGSGETEEQRAKREAERIRREVAKPIGRNRFAFVAGQAGRAGEAAGKAALRVGGRIGRFATTATNAELEKQREAIILMRKGLGEIQDKTGNEYTEFKAKVEKAETVHLANREKWNGGSTKFDSIIER